MLSRLLKKGPQKLYLTECTNDLCLLRPQNELFHQPVRPLYTAAKHPEKAEDQGKTNVGLLTVCLTAEALGCRA